MLVGIVKHKDCNDQAERTMEFERTKLDIDGPVGIVTLNHPEVMNAVSAEMLSGLSPRARRPPGARGTRGARGAGSTLQTHSPPFPPPPRELPIPFVTAVNG